MDSGSSPGPALPDRPRSALAATGPSGPTHASLIHFQEGPFVNKTELVEHIAKHADISKAAATRALDSTIAAIRTTLKKGGTVSLVGFGSFAVSKRPARKGRNPRTGAEIKIKAAKVPKFRPGKALKDAVN
ncbi:HU family DNA-binding protein [Hydrogenophaga intermedia]